MSRRETVELKTSRRPVPRRIPLERIPDKHSGNFMINPLKPLITPEYLFRPTQMLLRCKRSLFKSPPERQRVRLPWGARILIRPYETIGSNIWYYGIFDLIVAEAIDRLLDAGETGIDIGANIGQMTSLMSRRAGEKGKVLSFEPHPDVFAELCANIPFREKKKGFSPVSLYNLGLSDREGNAVMEIGPDWANNRGTARIASTEAKAAAQTVKIQVGTLEKILGRDTEVAVCKIDVEGHELKVFQGASHLLGERRIRDILFEDENPCPTEVQKMLIGHGYTIFSMHIRLPAPLLLPLTNPPARVNRRDRPDFLATLDPQRALERFRHRGWRVLK